MKIKVEMQNVLTLAVDIACPLARSWALNFLSCTGKKNAIEYQNVKEYEPRGRFQVMLCCRAQQLTTEG